MTAAARMYIKQETRNSALFSEFFGFGRLLRRFGGMYLGCLSKNSESAEKREEYTMTVGERRQMPLLARVCLERFDRGVESELCGKQDSRWVACETRSGMLRSNPLHDIRKCLKDPFGDLLKIASGRIRIKSMYKN